MFKKPLIIAFSLLILVISNKNLYSAKNEITDFTKKGGKVHRSNQKLRMKRGMEIRQGDKLITKKGVTVFITLKSGSRITLRENTKITLKALKAKVIKIRIQNGTVVANIKKSRKKQRFQLDGLTTSVSVKGTSFTMRVDRELKKVWVSVKEGKVKVTETKTKSSRIIKSGLGVVVYINKPIGTPVPYDIKIGLKSKKDQPKTAEKASDKSDDIKRHHISIFGGATYSTHKDKKADDKLFPTVGVNYEYRLPFLNNLLGITLLADFSFAKSTNTILAGGVVVHPFGGLILLGAPGIKLVRGENTAFLFRAGVGYDIYIGELFSITPIVNLDYTNGDFAYVFGIGFGIGF